jgi:hypothetical protein
MPEKPASNPTPRTSKERGQKGEEGKKKEEEKEGEKKKESVRPSLVSTNPPANVLRDKRVELVP